MRIFQKLLAVALVLVAGSLFANEKGEPALGGDCPVCYLAAGKAVKGTADFQTEYRGQIYYFVKPSAVDAFRRPQKSFFQLTTVSVLTECRSVRR